MGGWTAFTIEISGVSYGGAWSIEDQDVLVDSAWESDREPIGRRNPEKVAAGLLRDIVERRQAVRRARRTKDRPSRAGRAVDGAMMADERAR